MQLSRIFLTVVTAGLAAGLAACGASEDPAPAAAVEPTEPPPPSFRGDIPMRILMQGPVQLAADVYWKSVMIVVDIEGEHIHQPETEDDWHMVWQAGISIAESANLMMDDERALDQGDWLRMSNALYDAGLSAARAAEAQDYERVLDEGEKVYNACVACHEQYVPTVRL